MKKKVIVSLIIASMVVGNVNFIEQPKNVFASTVSTETGKLVKSGNFQLREFSNSVNVVKYEGDESEITIPKTFNGKPVKVIESGAFSNSSLSTITMDSIETIQENAFLGSSISIINASALKYIGKEAFKNAESLSSIVGNSIQSVGESAFEGCVSLNDLTLSNVTEIKKNAFKSCYSLYNALSMPKLTEIGEGAFEECTSLPSLNISEINTIGKGAFKNCSSLESVTLGSKIKTLEVGVFENCTSLSKVGSTNNTLVSINKVNSKAFSNCSMLESLNFQTETTISENAFENCYSLEIVNLKKGTIGDKAFIECSSLKKVTGDIVTIGKEAFKNCYSLKEIGVNGVCNATEIGEGAFANTGISNITLPNITKINKGVFESSLLENITIKNCKEIGEGAFKNCSSLVTVTGGSLTTIGKEAFKDCYSLKKLASSTNEYLAIKNIGTNAFDGCYNLIDTFKFEVSGFTTDKVSPQVQGTSIKLTAKASGGNGTLQYKFIVKDSKGNWSMIRDYSTSNTCTWNPGTSFVGNNTLCVDIKNFLGEVTRKELQYKINNKVLALTINSFTTDKVSPQVQGTSIKLTAKASGGNGTLQYRFRVGTANGNSSIIKDYSTSNISTWNANYPGTKILYVDVKDSKGTVQTKTLNYTINNLPLTINSFTSDKASPQVQGTSIKLTAKASGGNGTLQYKYYRYLNGEYALIKDWNTSNSVLIAPSKVGTYDLWVAIKDSTGKIVRRNMAYEIKSSDKISIKSFTSDKVSPQAQGSQIKLTASAIGGNGTLQYKFVITDNKGNWSILRDYSTSNTYTWKATSLGNKTLYVKVKDSKGTEVSKALNYEIVNPITFNSFKTDKVSPQLEGTQVKLTASATGGTGTLQYKFVITDGNGNWNTLKDYSTSNTCTWNATKPGNKILYCKIKDSKGIEVTKTLNYTVYSKLKVNKLDIKNTTGSVTINVSATGGKGQKKYQYSYCDEEGNFKILSQYSTSNTYIWKTSSIKNGYTIFVDVIDESGSIVRKFVTYNN